MRRMKFYVILKRKSGKNGYETVGPYQGVGSKLTEQRLEELMKEGHSKKDLLVAEIIDFEAAVKVQIEFP